MARATRPGSRPAWPGRFVVVSTAIHGAAFLVFSTFAQTSGAPPAPTVISSVLIAEPPELLPDPEPPPPPPPDAECPEFDEAVVEAPELEVAWEPVTIGVATRTGDVLARTPRAKPRTRPAPAAATTLVVAAPPPPPPPPPPVAAQVEPPPAPREKSPPRALSMEKPAYPEEARASGVEGAVRLEVTIAADGSVDDVRVVESSGSAILDAAAIACVRRWRFAAATEDGVGVVSVVRIPPIRFRLDR